LQYYELGIDNLRSEDCTGTLSGESVEKFKWVEESSTPLRKLQKSGWGAPRSQPKASKSIRRNNVRDRSLSIIVTTQLRRHGGQPLTSVEPLPWAETKRGSLIDGSDPIR